MAKLIEFNKETHRGFERGMNTLTDTVKVTLDPKGRNVVLEKKRDAPTIINDGASIAEEIELDDPYRKVDAELVKEVAKKTDDVAGDGATTATVVTQTMIHEGLRNITVGASPMTLRRGVEAAVAAIAGELSELAIDVEAEKQTAATVSVSAADPSVGRIIAEAMDKVDKENMIIIEGSNIFGLELELTEGMRFDEDYTLPCFVTGAERARATPDDPYVLIVNSKISSLKDLLPVLEEVMQPGRSLPMTTESVEGKALADLIVSKLRDTFKSIVVRAPGFSDCRKAMLGDIAILTGGQMIAGEVGLSFETVTLDLLGRARQVIVTKDECTIVDGNGTQTQIEGRVAQIHREIENSNSGYDREKLQERLAELAGGVAVIKAGAVTEVELKKRKHRIEDIVHNAKAAVEGSIVPSGGVVLLQASKVVKVEDLDDSEMVGANIVFAAAQTPPCQIAMNAGLKGDVIAEKIVGLPKDHGLDAATGEYADMVAAEIIDPAKVTCSAPQNATSITALFLTTKIVIADEPERVSAAADAPGMDEMGGIGGF